MLSWLGKYSDILYSILRIVAGLLFALHGAQKLFGMFGAQGPASEPLYIVAGIIELFGGLLVFLGLGTGYAAFIASGQMAVAYFMAHAPQGFWPIENRGELAALYCFLFLYMASRGSGSLSVDGLIRKGKLKSAA
ncbi:MAG: DoxX family protein [Acidobacteria bacterium]|nr:DoxX family protein [Acidobacteriota bacterium]